MTGQSGTGGKLESENLGFLTWFTNKTARGITDDREIEREASTERERETKMLGYLRLALQRMKCSLVHCMVGEHLLRGCKKW